MPVWVEYILRILMAIGLGFIIGLERKLRYKEAGMRTHAVVAAGSCLIMLVSKYGFYDVENYDAARVVAQVVSGIGFLGAGMILYKGQSVHGLTSAAGVWFTAGVGIATGAGMYIIASSATLLIILLQCILHINCRLFSAKRFREVKISYVGNEGNTAAVKELFGIERFTDVKAEKRDGDVLFSVVVRTDKSFDAEFIRSALEANPDIISIQSTEDEN